MDHPMDTKMLQVRANAALRTRRSLLLSSLRNILQSIREEIIRNFDLSNNVLPSKLMVQILQLSETVHTLTNFISLHPIPLTPISLIKASSCLNSNKASSLASTNKRIPISICAKSHGPSSTSQPSTISSSSATIAVSDLTDTALMTNSPNHRTPNPDSSNSSLLIQLESSSDGFQRRTFYQSNPIDERRAPAAEWAPMPPSSPQTPLSRSLSVNFSTDTLDTLDSFVHSPYPTSPYTPKSNPISVSYMTPPPLPYAHGYSGFRVDVQYPSYEQDYRKSPLQTESISMNFRKQEVDQSHRVEYPPRKQLQFFEPNVEVVNVIELRDNIFEIGTDGRIRSQTPK